MNKPTSHAQCLALRCAILHARLALPAGP